MMTKAKIGAAVLGGYVLGRKKKARLALGLGALLAGAKIKPRELAGALAGSPLLGSVNEQVRGELLNAGKEAATSVLTARANSLADTLHERTLDLQGKKQEDEAGDEDGHEEQDREERESRAPTRKPGRAPRKTAAPARKAAPSTRKTGDRPRRDKVPTGSSRSSGEASGGRSRRPHDD